MLQGPGRALLCGSVRFGDVFFGELSKLALLTWRVSFLELPAGCSRIKRVPTMSIGGLVAEVIRSGRGFEQL